MLFIHFIKGNSPAQTQPNTQDDNCTICRRGVGRTKHAKDDDDDQRACQHFRTKEQQDVFGMLEAWQSPPHEGALPAFASRLAELHGVQHHQDARNGNGRKKAHHRLRELRDPLSTSTTASNGAIINRRRGAVDDNNIPCRRVTIKRNFLI